MYTVAVKLSFNSAHRLLDYKGKCENLHGHNWYVEVLVAAEELDDSGMVADYAEVKKKVNSFLKNYDHVYLNELDDFKNLAPTSENIAALIFKKSSALINDDRVKTKRVTVWETKNNKASYEE